MGGFVHDHPIRVLLILLKFSVSIYNQQFLHIPLNLHVKRNVILIKPDGKKNFSTFLPKLSKGLGKLFTLQYFQFNQKI